MAEMFEKKTVMTTVKKILDKYAKACEISRNRSVELMRTNEAKMDVAKEIYDALEKIRTDNFRNQEPEQQQQQTPPKPVDIPKPTFDPNKPENKRREPNK